MKLKEDLTQLLKRFMNNPVEWNKLGLILEPDIDLEWLQTWAGASCAVPIDYDNDLYRIYVTGKDGRNRSRIGHLVLDLKNLSTRCLSSAPILELGERGSFDENGTSYPFVMFYKQKYYLYYLGWVQGIQVPWYNGLGLAISNDGINFDKYSKAPIFERNSEDYLGVGSMFIIEENNNLRMWYSRFVAWGKSEADHKHYYNIKYAESKDGIVWKRRKEICIDFIDPIHEFAIAKPAVIKLADKYCMWYSHRGESYKIGFAVSNDGTHWNRHDNLVGIDYSASGWDSEMLCYAFVFLHKETLYMLYNGNGYGSTGLGIASMKLSDFNNLIKDI
ncbi:hypothetical protein JNM05_12050 [bacterium]|nr:hypothetical protein [bacterium]